MPRPHSSLVKDSFRRRKETTRKKVEELSSFCHTQVYVVLFHHGRYHVYSSMRTRSWPPTAQDIVSRECWTTASCAKLIGYPRKRATPSQMRGSSLVVPRSEGTRKRRRIGCKAKLAELAPNQRHDGRLNRARTVRYSSHDPSHVLFRCR